MTNKFQYTDILEMVTRNENIGNIVSQLKIIKTSYSTNIIKEIENANFEQALMLIKASTKFETKVNGIDVTKIVFSDKDIQDRINRDVWINGMTEDDAKRLALRRADRLSNGKIMQTMSIEHGRFLI